MLTEKQLCAIDLLVEGKHTKVDIAKLTGVSRQAIYDWLDNPEFVAEIDRRLQDLKADCNKKIAANLDSVVSELLRLALTGKDEKTRSTACQYLINRVLGTPTTTANISADVDTANTNIDLLEAFEQAKRNINSDK